MAMQQPLLKAPCCRRMRALSRARATNAPGAGMSRGGFHLLRRGGGWCEIAGRSTKWPRTSCWSYPPPRARLWRVEKEPWTIHWFHAIGTNVPFYLEKLEVKPENRSYNSAATCNFFPFRGRVGRARTRIDPETPDLRGALPVTSDGADPAGTRTSSGGEIDVRNRRRRAIKFMKEHLREPLRISTLAACGQPVAVRITRPCFAGDRVRAVDVFKTSAHATPVSCSTPQILSIKAISDSARFFRSILLFLRFQQAPRPIHRQNTATATG